MNKRLMRLITLCKYKYTTDVFKFNQKISYKF